MDEEIPNRYYLCAWNVEQYTPLIHAWLKTFLENQKPSILFLSETKCSKEKLTEYLLEFNEYSFIMNVHNPSRYHGVAMLIRKNNVFSEISAPFHVKKRSDTNGNNGTCGRVISILFENKYIVVGTYVPNSGRNNDMKKMEYRIQEWDPSLQDYLNDCATTHPTIWLGDINVALSEQDVSDPKKMKRYAGFTQAERDSFQNFLIRKNWVVESQNNSWLPESLQNYAWVDIWRNEHKTKKLYSWRGNNMGDNSVYGMRLDNILVSVDLSSDVVKTFMINDCPLSDHVPVCAHILKKIK
jgi:exodeoxyribonuclease III